MSQTDTCKVCTSTTDTIAEKPQNEKRSNSDKSLNLPPNGSPSPYERKTQETPKAICYDKPSTHKTITCPTSFQWQRKRYVRDDCGSGILQEPTNYQTHRRNWCKTPLTMYQSTIGELGRKVLCGETKIIPDIKSEPPCAVCEYILPPCREYYRKYDCIRECEKEEASYKHGTKVYRDKVERYWLPCLTAEERKIQDIRNYAPHNAYLGMKLRRHIEDTAPCW